MTFAGQSARGPLGQLQLLFAWPWFGRFGPSGGDVNVDLFSLVLSATFFTYLLE